MQKRKAVHVFPCDTDTADSDLKWEEVYFADEADAALIEVGALLKESKRSHLDCPDCWYSCAILTCNDSRKSEICDCGADKWNAKVDELLQKYYLL